MTNLDAIVAGAGPAGLSSALKLARLGHRVVVLDRPPAPRGPRLETILDPSLIDFVFPGVFGTGDAIRSAPVAGVSWWSGEARPTPPAVVIDRPRFDEQLRHVARAQGIAFVETSPAITLQREAAGWRVSLGSDSWRAPVVIDATGRHSALRQRAPLVRWRQIAITRHGAPETCLPALSTEAFADGWLWAVRGPGTLALTVFAAPTGGRPSAIWEHALATTHVGRLVRGTSWSAMVETRDVTPVSTTAPSAPGLLHAGDAFVSRDPLASQGLAAAIADGQSTAIAAHTLLTDPHATGLVAEFMANRLQRARVEHTAFLGATYAASGRTEAYWQARRPTGDSWKPATFHPGRPLIISSAWRLRPSAIATAQRIVSAECLCATNGEDVIGWLGGIAVGRWLAALSSPRLGSELIAEWSRCALAPQAQLPRVLRQLFDRGILVHARDQ